jgi:hypothetical protein
MTKANTMTAVPVARDLTDSESRDVKPVNATLPSIAFLTSAISLPDHLLQDTLIANATHILHRAASGNFAESYLFLNKIYS